MPRANSDIHSLSYTKWECKYHIVLHRNIDVKYFMNRNGLKSV